MSDTLSTVVTFFLESMAYGMNIISFVACLSTLLFAGCRLRPRRSIHWIMVGAALTLFLISTADAIVTILYVVEMFVRSNPRTNLELQGINEWWSVSSFSCFVAQTFLGDVILIYRCFIIWNRRLAVVIVPIITSTTGTTCGVTAAVIGATSSANQHTNHGTKLTPLIVCLICLTMTTNFVTSSLIVSRIWNVKRDSSRFRSRSPHPFYQDPLGRAIRVTVEAGLIYSASLIALIVTYMARHTSQIPVSRIIVQIIAITFNLVITTSERKFDRPHVSSSATTSPSQTPVVKMVDMVREPTHDIESSGPSSTNSEGKICEEGRGSW